MLKMRERFKIIGIPHSLKICGVSGELVFLEKIATRSIHSGLSCFTLCFQAILSPEVNHEKFIFVFCIVLHA